jgi:hypothetical protein
VFGCITVQRLQRTHAECSVHTVVINEHR